MSTTNSAKVDVPARLAQELCLLAVASSKQLPSLLTSREVPRLLAANLTARVRVPAILPWIENQVATRLRQADLMHLALIFGGNVLSRGKSDQ